MCLEKLDKSKVGEVDADIKPLVDFINNSEDYFTTSSCAGRIVLLAQPESGKKNECQWLFHKHDEVEVAELKEKIKELPKDKDVWLRQEAAILHICCRTIDHAQKILEVAHKAGFKRGGVTGFGAKTMIEIMSTEHMEAIVAKKGELLIKDSYLYVLVDEANRKLRRTKQKIKKFYEELIK